MSHNGRYYIKKLKSSDSKGCGKLKDFFKSPVNVSEGSGSVSTKSKGRDHDEETSCVTQCAVTSSQSKVVNPPNGDVPTSSVINSPPVVDSQSTTKAVTVSNIPAVSRTGRDDDENVSDDDCCDKSSGEKSTRDLALIKYIAWITVFVFFCHYVCFSQFHLLSRFFSQSQSHGPHSQMSEKSPV